MAGSSQIIFYEPNYLQSKFNPTINLSSGTTYVENLYDRDYSTKWLSDGTGDTETIEVNFGEDKDVSFLHFVGINWEQYQVQYWDGGSSYVDFSPPISITSGTMDVAFHNQFTKVSTQKVRVSIDSTFPANQAKEATQVNISDKVGQFVGWPKIEPALEKQVKTIKKLSGRESVLIQGVQFRCKIKFETYPEEDDIDLVRELQDRREEFQVWLCGGDQTQFKYEIEPFREKDIYLVAETGKGKIILQDGIYSIGYTMDLDLKEV